jgi:hypothetical protein
MHGIADAVRTVLVSVAAAVTGGLLMRWWDRARALVLIRGFVNVVATEEIECSAALRQLTQRVWRLRPLPEKERGDRVQDMNRRVREERCLALEDRALLPQLRCQLAAAASDADVLEVVKTILEHYALPYAIVEAVGRSILVPPPASADTPDKVRVEFEDFDNGRYLVRVYGGSGKTIGENLNDQPALRQQLDAWLNAVRKLDREAFLAAVDALPPLLAEQAEIDRQIALATQPLLERHGRWMIKLFVTNYGSKDMVVWPDAALVVRGSRNITERCVLESIEDPETRRLHELVGVHILPAGSTAMIWARTERRQRDMPHGAALRDAYERGTAIAHMALHITRRRSLRGFATRSDKAVFSEHLDTYWPSSCGWDAVIQEVDGERVYPLPGAT